MVKYMKTDKDTKYLTWTVSGARIFSTCGKRNYMAVIVDRHGFVAGVGYNGVPPGFTHCIDGGCPRFNSDSAPGSDYGDCLANHAEANAIMNSFSREGRIGGTIYVNGPPCYTCGKLIAGSGVARLVYTSDPDYVYAQWGSVERILMQAGIETIHISPEELWT